jgi:hypothetical protein
MRRPPIVSFLTFNKLGNTVLSLTSLLRTLDDFELYLIDNDSKDGTWEFLQDTKDPRIVHKKRFDGNIGVGHALNYVLFNRKEDQDWINIEYDFRILNKNFIQYFQEAYKSYPEMGGFSATSYPIQYNNIKEAISRDITKIKTNNNINVYLDTIMGFCSFFPYEVMNLLGYYDEVNYFLDIDFNHRINACLNKKTGYLIDLRCAKINDIDLNCVNCLANLNYCQGNHICLKYYNRIVGKVIEKLGGIGAFPVVGEKRIKGLLPIKCNSIFSNIPMSDIDKQESLKIMNLYKQFYKDFLETLK